MEERKLGELSEKGRSKERADAMNSLFSFKPGEVITADMLNSNFDVLATSGINSSQIKWDQTTCYPTAFCADCFSKDYKTKRHATFIAHGFSLCEDCFRRYCENQKKVYDKSWREANGR